MSIKRKEDEALEDYKVRLCSNKAINSHSWQDICDLVNESEGTSNGESVVRKWWADFSSGQEYEIKKKASSEDTLDEYTIKKFELQKERNKLQAEKLEVNKWIREQARSENIYEKIGLAIAELQPVTVPEINIRLDSDNKKTKTAVIDIADAHYGREGKIMGLHGDVIADYNIEIFERRMWMLLERTVEICEKEDISFVSVVNSGDVIDGLLRLSQLQFLQLGVVESTMGVAEFISQWLNKLSEHVEIDYYSLTGNHSEARFGNTKSGELKDENFEIFIPWFIKERLIGNKRVKVHDAKHIQLIDVLGTNILCVHGQDEKNLENSIKDYSMIYQTPIHILKTGHLHHTHNKTIGMAGAQNVEFMQAPSICGIDEYSMKLKKTANAGSMVTVFESGYGKVCSYDIRFK